MIIVSRQIENIGSQDVADFDDYVDGKLIVRMNVPFVFVREATEYEWLNCAEKRADPPTTKAELKRSLKTIENPRFYEISID